MTDIVHDIHVVNTDTKSYVKKTPERCIHEAAKAKNKKYLEACIQKCRHFSPFFISVNGLMGMKAEATLKRISSHLATK